MGNELGNSYSYKRSLHWITSAIGTFLFVFLMMHMFVLHFSGVYDGMWLVPYFSIPAYFFCLTIATKYWIEENLVRRRSFFISLVIAAVTLFFSGLYLPSSYALYTGFRSILAAMASVGVILYSVLNIRKKEKTSQQIKAGQETLQTAGTNKWKQVARIICLLSICCVLFENWQKSIMVSYGILTHEYYSMSLPTFSHYFLSIFSAILLARFVKAEFLPINVSANGDAS
ncbi:MAG TPA: hypothetical protein PKA81_09415 [Clostridia bacterium]|nr:hypothetical protein [Clostridia bacterium]